MRKLHIGKVIEQLSGKPQKLIEDNGKRDMTIRDAITQLIPAISGQRSKDALLLWDIGLRIHNSKDDRIELENHDYDVLKAALGQVQAVVWVQACLAKVFEESDAIYQKQDEKEDQGRT